MTPTSIDQPQASSDDRSRELDPDSWPCRMKKAVYASVFIAAVASWLAAAASAMYFAVVDAVRG